MKNNLDTPVAKQCRALYTKYAYGHTYGLLKVGLSCRCIWDSDRFLQAPNACGWLCKQAILI